MKNHFAAVAQIYKFRVILENGKNMIGGLAETIEQAESIANAHRAMGKKVRIVCR